MSHLSFNWTEKRWKNKISQTNIGVRSKSFAFRVDDGGQINQAGKNLPAVHL